MRWLLIPLVAICTTLDVVSQEPAAGCDEPAILGRPVLCDGGSTTISVDVGCWITWEWSTGSRAPSITVTQPGQYWVRGLHTSSGSEVQVFVDVVAAPAPRPTIGNPLEYICQGDVAILQARDDYIDYRWSTGASGNTLVISEAGTYWLEVTDTNGCVGRSDEVEIIVVDKPDLDITGPLDVCRDDELTYRVTSVAGATYSWSIDGGTIVSGASTSSVRVSWSRSGSLQVRAVVPRPDGGICDSTTSIFVQAKPRVRADLTYDRSSFCTGGSTTLTLLGDYSSWRWNTGETSRSITVASGGPYWVEVVDSNGCPGITDTLRVREYPLPQITVDGPSSICGDEPIILTASSSADDVVLWEWSTSATTAQIVVDQPGTYRVVGWTLNGCTDTVAVTVSEADPLVVISSDIDFGTVAVGVPQQGIITVENNGPQNVNISRIIVIDPTVVVSPVPPRLVAAGSAITFDVTWIPTQATSLDLPIVFNLVSSECTDTAVSFVRGVSRNDTTGALSIRVADTIVPVGTELLLPLELSIVNPTSIPIDISFGIQVDAGVYHITGLGDVEGGYEVDWGQDDGRIRRFRVTVTAAPGVTQRAPRFRGVTLLGAPFQTLVMVDDIQVESSVPFITDEDDGSVELTGCWLPGRMINEASPSIQRRYFAIDGREVADPQQCRPCLQVLQDANGTVLKTYLMNSISR